MVTDARWVDIDKDGWEDLMVVGQFMPIHLFMNQKGLLVDKSADWQLGETDGWWRRLLAEDMDGDGDIDFVVGNIGLNTPFKASTREPISITYGSFYTPGIINPIFCYYNGGINYPWNSKDEIASQIPTIQQKFLRYEDYGKASLSDLIPKGLLDKSNTVKANMLQSIFLRNNGNNTFTGIPLPMDAQVSALQGIIPFDYDNDGKKDLLIAGNLYPFRVQSGPLDASIGLVLKSDTAGQFRPVTYAQTGLLIEGDVRNLVQLKGKNSDLVIVARNDNKIEVLEMRTGKR